MKCDCHIHTVYSGHSAPDMTVRNITDRAGALGLETVVILEHAFYSAMGRACLEEIKKEAGKTGGMVTVLTGLEIDPDYKRKGRLVFEDFDARELDVVLVGMHAIPNTGKGWCADLNLTRQERRCIYHSWFEIMESVVENSPVDILAHPGRMISRNNIIKAFDDTVLKDFERLFLAAGKNGVAVELNEGLLNNFPSEKLRESYPEVIRLAMKMGLKIALGSDAHTLERIGANTEAKQVMETLNLQSDNMYLA